MGLKAATDISDVRIDDEGDDGASDDAQEAVIEEDGADEDVEDAAAEEGEHEGGVARDLGGDLELEQGDGEPEHHHVGADDDGLAARRVSARAAAARLGHSQA